MIPMKVNRNEPNTIAAALSSVDQRMRRCVQELWVLLPEDQREPKQLKAQFRRLSERALENFLADHEQFPGSRGSRSEECQTL